MNELPILETLDVTEDSGIELKDLFVVDKEGVRHNYHVSPKQIKEHKRWRDLFDMTEGKELSWNHLSDLEPVEAPDGFYIVLGSGGCVFAEVKDKAIIHTELFGSSDLLIWSYLERYYEEKKQAAEKESTDPDGSVRVEGAEIY